MLPEHLDPMMPLDIPDHVKDRLIKREAQQRYRINRKNREIEAANALTTEAQQIPLLPVEKVDIIQIGEDQEWTCACHEAPLYEGCYQRMDIHKTGNHPETIVIGHVIASANAGGHTPQNVRLMRNTCNMDIAHKVETGQIAKAKRSRKKNLGVTINGEEWTPPAKSKFPKPTRKMKSKSQWPKRKMKSRNTFKK